MKSHAGKIGTTLLGAAILIAAPISLRESPDKGLSISLNSAEARIGRPLTPGSVAGVIGELIAAARMVLLATKSCTISNCFAGRQRPPSTRRLLCSEGSQARSRLLTDNVESSPIKGRKLADFSAIPTYDCPTLVPRQKWALLNTAGTMRLCNQSHRRGVCNGAMRLTALFPV